MLMRSRTHVPLQEVTVKIMYIYTLCHHARQKCESPFHCPRSARSPLATISDETLQSRDILCLCATAHKHVTQTTTRPSWWGTDRLTRSVPRSAPPPRTLHCSPV